MHELLAACLSAALSVALAAQTSASGRSTLSDDALAQFAILQPHERGWLAAGRDYKAYCTADGVEFVPALGSAAPHNLPVRLRLRDLRRGDAVLHEATPVEPFRGEGRLCYRRGTTDEVYDVRTDGLKQSFVFHRRPTGSGDLVVRFDLDTELQPTQLADGAIDLLAPGLGGVRIGEVLAFDAEGKQCKGSLRLLGKQLDLVLAGEFVDRATMPLTLDPLIGTTAWLPSANARTPYECDVAAGMPLSSLVYLVVFSSSFSANDYDVYAVRYAPGSGSSATLALDASPTVRSQRPRVGYVADTRRFLVAWHDSTAARVLRDVRCVTVDATTMTASGVVNIAASAADEFHVAVAGDVSTTPSATAIVAWESDSGISMRKVAAPALGNPVPQAVTQLAAGAGTNTPALSKSVEADSSLIAVWQAPGPLGLDIFAQLLTRDLVRVGPVLALGGGSPIDDREPAVDGSVIAWSRESSSFPTATFDLYGAFVQRSSAGLTLRAGPRALATSSTADELGADVARIGWRHCVAYHVLASDGTSTAFAWLVNDDCTTCNARMPINVAFPFPQQDSGLQPRIGSAALLGADDGGLIACSNNPSSIQRTLRVQVVQNLGPGRPPVEAGSGAGCGSITFYPDESAFVVGNSRFVSRCVAFHQTLTLLILSVGLGSSWVNCGPCIVTNPFVVVPSTSLGIGQATFPVPCDPGFIGVPLEMQWQGIAPNANGACPLVPQLSVSNRRTYVISD